MPHPGGDGELASEVMVKELIGHDHPFRAVKLVHGASLLALVHLHAQGHQYMGNGGLEHPEAQ